MRDFLALFPSRLREYHDLLTNNRLWIDRTKGIAPLTAATRWPSAAPAPTLRGSGVTYDVRKAFPYGGYDRFEFDIPVGSNGDVYDRYLIRMLEMEQSLHIIQQALDGLPEGPWQIADHKIVAAAEVGGVLQHGGADPPLQALHRRLPPARRRGLACARSRPRASLASTW